MPGGAQRVKRRAAMLGVAAAATIAAALSHSDGSFSCMRNHPAATMPGSPATLSQTDAASLACTGRSCVLSATKSFKGYVVTGVGAASAMCLKHSSNAPKSTYSFTVQGTGRATVYATVVFENVAVYGHKYATASSPVMAVDPHVYIVGAGPGGLAAARYALTLADTKVTVFERGDHAPPGFYEGPIADTAAPSGPLSRTDTPFGDTMVGNMVGGAQAINGAVFKPGAPSDLARSLGLSLKEAIEVQRLSGSYVGTLPLPPDNTSAMMWACINASACDHANVAATNVGMKRRSIGYNFTEDVGDRVTLEVNTTVLSVSDTTITFAENSRPPITVRDGDAVILAAGALLSPGLIGQPPTSWLNHYYRIDAPTSVATDPQTFDYPDGSTGAVEINEGTYTVSNNISIVLNRISIYMDMNLNNLRETVDASGIIKYPAPYPKSNGQNPGWSTAWHYHGTMAHDGQLLVPGFERVYTGDAGALQTSFNCHTSMPAAAAGVAAVRGWAGLQLDPITNEQTVQAPGGGWRPVWVVVFFVAGSWALVVGIAAHVAGAWLDSTAIKKAHYALMPLGTVLVTSAAVAVEASGDSDVSTKEHRRLGWATIGVLWAQALYGASLRAMSPYPRALGIVHRVIGWALLFAVLALAWTSEQGVRSRLRNDTLTRPNAIAVTAVAGLVGLAADGWLLRGLWRGSDERETPSIVLGLL